MIVCIYDTLAATQLIRRLYLVDHSASIDMNYLTAIERDDVSDPFMSLFLG